MSSAAMKSILFVDDEPNILQGLQRMLRPLRGEWEMCFAKSGQDALDLMATRHFDVIVTDLRMPGMDGAALLSRVKELYPHMVRMVLSGQSDKETLLRSAGPTHQFLAKPCDPDTLTATVGRAFALRELLGNETLKRLVSQLANLPALPQVYQDLMVEIQSPDASPSSVAQIIESDVALTAKTLHYANSAFFGIRQHVTNTTQAVSLLGLDIIRSLVLLAGVFAQVDLCRLPRLFSLDAFSSHSLQVGILSRSIAKCMSNDEKDASECFTAGVLHDTGMLVLAVGCPDDYEAVLERTLAEGVRVDRAEVEMFGAGHAEVGAYLLGLWGFPDPIVEAVAFHPWPSRCVSRAFSPLSAVHAANTIVERSEGSINGMPAELDMAYLMECDLDRELPAWVSACNEVYGGRVP